MLKEELEKERAARRDDAERASSSARAAQAIASQEASSRHSEVIRARVEVEQGREQIRALTAELQNLRQVVLDASSGCGHNHGGGGSHDPGSGGLNHSTSSP